MKYFLKTTYPCLVKISNETFELDSFDTLEIEDEKYVFVYPQEDLCPFCINLINPVENEHFSILNHNSKTFLVLEGAQKFRTTSKQTVSANGKNCIVSIQEKLVSFETENRKTEAKILSPKSYQISQNRNFVFVKFEKELFAFNIQNEKLSHFTGEKIEVENDTIKVEKRIDSRTKISTYQIGESLNLLNETFSEDAQKFPSELLPLKFLECIKLKDFECAIEKLSPNLKGQITKENLGDFFGNFTSILPLGTSEFITLSNMKKNFVKFSIKDDKVEDILIDEL